MDRHRCRQGQLPCLKHYVALAMLAAHEAAASTDMKSKPKFWDENIACLQAVHQAWVARQYATMADLLTKLRTAIAHLPADKRGHAEAVASAVRST